MSARCCAPATDITAAACATARRAGRVPSATSHWASAKCPAAMDTGAVSRAIVTANVGGKDNSANNVSRGRGGSLGLKEEEQQQRNVSQSDSGWTLERVSCKQ